MKEAENKGTMYKVWDKLKKISSEAYEKGKEYTAIAELKIKISSLNKEKNNLYAEMGEILFELIGRKEEDICNRTEIRSRYEKICVINDKIGNLEFDINRIKEEHNINDADLKRVAEEEEEKGARKQNEKKQEKKEKKTASPGKKASSSSKSKTGEKKAGTGVRKGGGVS